MSTIIINPKGYPASVIRASFGPKDSKAPRYCATHKPIGHVNVKTQCQEDGCYKFPHLGFSSSKATSCVTHMKDGMIHLRVRKCLEPGCTTRAVFNVVGLDKGKFCAKRAKHKKPEMIDIQTKICKYSGCQKKALFAVEGHHKLSVVSISRMA
ncbi:18994_t:CDS:2 [Rhizophagus irregularis]|nr:18994_t:CDS:2 [Rhizophagus irregularis]